MADLFKTGQNKLQQVEKKAGLIDAQTGKKNDAELEKEYLDQRKVFFDQVDGTEKAFMQGQAIKNPTFKAEVGKDEEEIKRLLNQAAESGEDILKKKGDRSFNTIRQSAEKVSRMTGLTEKNVGFFKDLDEASAFHKTAQQEIIHARAEMNSLKTLAKNGPIRPDQLKQLNEYLLGSMDSLGQDGAMGLLAKYSNHLPSSEFRNFYDGLKKSIDDAMHEAADMRAYSLEHFESDDAAKEKRTEESEVLLAVKKGSASADGKYGEGYDRMYSRSSIAKDQLKRAAGTENPGEKQQILDEAKAEFVAAKFTALKLNPLLNSLDPGKLPDDLRALHFAMKVNTATTLKEATSEINRLEKGIGFVDGKAVIDAVEKEYTDGLDSPKKSYERMLAVWEFVASGEKFDVTLDGADLQEKTDEAVQKNSKLSRELASVDRKSLSPEYQARFDRINGTVTQNLMRLHEILFSLQAKQFIDALEESGKRYFNVNRLPTGDLALQPNDEFFKLPNEQQEVLISQIEMINRGIVIDMTRKLDLPEDKDWNDGIKKFENGDWQGAKGLLLSYCNKFRSHPEKSAQISGAIGMLQGIMRNEWAEAKNNMEMMAGIQKERGGIAGVTRQDLAGSLVFAWKKIDQAEAEIATGQYLRIEDVWAKIGKPEGKDLAVEVMDASGKSRKISFMDPAVQQEMLSEPDPVKRKANILLLARAGQKAGMSPFAKKYFERFFGEQIEERKKTVTRQTVADAFNEGDGHKTEVQAAIKAAHDQARVAFITTMNRKHGDRSTTDETLKKWEATYAEKSGNIEDKVREGIIDDLWQQKVKKSIHQDMMNMKPGTGSPDDPLNVWHEAYGTREVPLASADPVLSMAHRLGVLQNLPGPKFQVGANVAENLSGSALVFTSDDIRNTAAKIAVSVVYMELATVAAVVGALAAGGAVLGGGIVASSAANPASLAALAESGLAVGKGTAFAAGAASFLAEGAILHTVNVGLEQGTAGFKDKKAFLKGLAHTYLTVGVMKGSAVIIGKIGSGAAESIVSQSGRPLVQPLASDLGNAAIGMGKSVLKLTGKSAFDSAIMTALSYEKGMTIDQAIATFGNNLVTTMFLGAGHAGAVAHEGASPLGRAKGQSRDVVERSTAGREGAARHPRFNSVFETGVTAEARKGGIAEGSEGWVDLKGGIHMDVNHLNTGEVPVLDGNGKPVLNAEGKPQFQKIMADRYKARADVNGKFYIETPDGKHISLLEYEGLMRKDQPDRARTLLNTMITVKIHETIHQLTDLALTKEVVGTDGKVHRVPDPVKVEVIADKLATPDADGHVAEGKIPLVDSHGRPLEVNPENIQEFLCRVGDRTASLSVEQVGIIEGTMQSIMPEFSFKRARAEATKILAGSKGNPDVFAREKMAAKEGKTNYLGMEKLNNLLARDKALGADKREIAKTIMDYILILRTGDLDQMEQFKQFHEALVPREMFIAIEEQYKVVEKRIALNMGSPEGLATLRASEQAGKLTSFEREIYKRLVTERKMIGELSNSEGKTAEVVEANLKTLHQKFQSGELSLNDSSAQILMQTPEGLKVLSDQYTGLTFLSIAISNGGFKHMDRIPPEVYSKLAARPEGPALIIDALSSGKVDSLEQLPRDVVGRIADPPEFVAYIRENMRSGKIKSFDQLPEQAKAKVRESTTAILEARAFEALQNIDSKVQQMEAEHIAQRARGEEPPMEETFKLENLKKLHAALADIATLGNIEELYKRLESYAHPEKFSALPKLSDIFYASADRVSPDYLISMLQGRVKYDHLETGKGKKEVMYIEGRNLGIGGLGEVWSTLTFTPGSREGTEMVFKKPRNGLEIGNVVPTTEVLKHHFDQQAFNSLSPIQKATVAALLSSFRMSGIKEPNGLENALERARQEFGGTKIYYEFAAYAERLQAAYTEIENSRMVMGQQASGSLLNFTRVHFVSDRGIVFMESVANPNVNYQVCDFAKIIDGKVTSLDGEIPITPKQFWDGIASAMESVADAHDHDIIHRDIKPENIGFGPDKRVRVMDFGSARNRLAYSNEPFFTVTKGNPYGLAVPEGRSHEQYPNRGGITDGYYDGLIAFDESRGTLAEDLQPRVSFGGSDRFAFSGILQDIMLASGSAGKPSWATPEQMRQLPLVRRMLADPRGNLREAAKRIREIMSTP